ncbi:tripartite motif-containing protein 16-like [Engraulis encrasicolus]|uniref:tripartite motif-containing protein 16-like n=1 Tax=Engraulis encrasicolus TaxID=184585 RepID=UPI002FD2742C
MKPMTQFVKQKISEDISPDRTINLFHCLKELGDTSLLQEIKRLDRCDLSPSSCKILAKALQESPSHLRELDMSDNDLLDEGVKQLCLELKEPKHKLQMWRLKQCHISKASCEMMVLLLQRTSSSLRELDMSNNDLQDGGVELLSEGLRQPHCKLEKMRLSFCGISYRGCAFLSSALISNPSYLKLLDVSYNHPGDSGVRELMDRLNDPSCKLETLRHDHGGEYRIKPGPRRYACELTLDPNTANRSLYLSEGDTKVSTVTVEYQYDDHPWRFDCNPQVLCVEGLSSRCYWEAEWSTDYGAHIAVAYKSIERKRKNHESSFGLNDKSWSLRCDATSYCACHNGEGTDIPAPSPRSSRVGVYLDWKAGTLSFYSVSSDTLTHLHTFHATFTQPLVPGFGLPNDNSSVTLCQFT